MNTLAHMVLSIVLALTFVFQPPAPTPTPPARPVTPLPANRLPNDWIISPLNGHQYKLADCHFWQNCEDQAITENAHLVTINDEEENTWLISAFDTEDTAWIGFTDAAEEGVWQWASGDTSLYTHWGPLEPNNAGGCENYAVLYIRSQPSGDWNDAGYCIGSPDFPGIFERSNIGPVLPGSENWLGDSSLPGISGTVYSSIVMQDGDLIIGGSFATAGVVPQHNIAGWDGESWYSLGTGLSGTVYALAADDEGTIYAASSTAAGSSSTVYLLQNSRWTPVGENVNGIVSALAVDQHGYLYAGGAFTRIGNMDAQNVARWNGVRWQALAQGVDGPVYALVVDSRNTLVAGGDFETVPEAAVGHNVARWTGYSWQALGSGFDQPVRALICDSAGRLYAGGEFTASGAVTLNHIAVWQDEHWQPLGAGVNGRVNALTVVSSGALYAAGDFSAAGPATANRVALWWNNTWQPLAAGIQDGTVYTLAAKDASVFAGGRFTLVDDHAILSLAEWDGSAWVVTGQGVGGRVASIVETADGDVVIAGRFSSVAGVVVHNIARWDRMTDTWHAVGAGMDDLVSALAVADNGFIYAGGEFISAGGAPANHVAYWDGDAWHPLGSGVNQPVTALTTQGDQVYAGGYFTEAGGAAARYIAVWDQTNLSWQPVGPGMDYAVYALASDQAGSLYAGGNFNQAGDAEASFIAHWDGTQWRALGDDLDAPVHALVIDPASAVIAGGEFSAGVARWDGAHWQPIGAGMSSSSGWDPWVMALAFDQAGNLYSGGFFNKAEGRTVNYVARWDNGMWKALGTGIAGPSNPRVEALLASGQNILWAGGKFASAGDKVAANLARWIGPERKCDLTTGVYRFYETFLPVTITIVEPGTLSCLEVQLFNRSHWAAQSAQTTGAFWQIVATDSAGEPAGDYSVDLALPSATPADANDALCRYTGFGRIWDCAADAFDPVLSTVTRHSVSELMLHWTIGDGDLGFLLVPRMYFPVALHD